MLGNEYVKNAFRWMFTKEMYGVGTNIDAKQYIFTVISFMTYIYKISWNLSNGPEGTP